MFVNLSLCVVLGWSFGQSRWRLSLWCYRLRRVPLENCVLAGKDTGQKRPHREHNAWGYLCYTLCPAIRPNLPAVFVPGMLMEYWRTGLERGAPRTKREKKLDDGRARTPKNGKRSLENTTANSRLLFFRNKRSIWLFYFM